MDPLSSALGVLSAMITPAILISACGTLVLSTSNRLGRVVDRVRDLADKFEPPSGEVLSKQQAAKGSGSSLSNDHARYSNFRVWDACSLDIESSGARGGPGKRSGGQV